MGPAPSRRCSRTNSSTLEPRASWWMVRWPVGEAAVVVLWLSQWNRDGPRARSRHEQQVGLAGFVPEDAFAVDPARL